MKAKSLKLILEQELKELTAVCSEMKLEIGAIGTAVAKITKSVCAQNKLIANGADGYRPWDRLPSPRRKAVERAVAYMRETGEKSKWRAAKATFAATPGGFPTDKSLAACLYRTNVTPFL